MAGRVLVLSASVGAGHLRAAQAIELALKQAHPELTVLNLDVLTMTNAAFRRLYGKAYLDLVNHAPHLLGYFYDLMDQPSKSGKNRSDRLRLAIEKLNLDPFIRFLEKEPWDLVINTHFLPAEIIASLRRGDRLDTPQVTVTTDFETHRLWVNLPCEHFFTATEEGALNLQAWGVAIKDVTPTGIPIHPFFSQAKVQKESRAKLGIGDTRPVVLQSAGGFGVGPIEKIYRSILEIDTPLELVAITGKNQDAKAQLEAVEVPTRHGARVLGFTDQMDEWMAAADLVISKPGGLTTSETLARGAAMVIVNPIPGQESRNSDFLLENGAAIKVNSLSTLAHKVGSLLRDSTRLHQIKANAVKLARPRAAFDVVEKSLPFMKQSSNSDR